MVGGGCGEDLEDWGGLLGWSFFLAREGRGWGLGGAMFNCENFVLLP